MRFFPRIITDRLNNLRIRVGRQHNPLNEFTPSEHDALSSGLTTENTSITSVNSPLTADRSSYSESSTVGTPVGDASSVSTGELGIGATTLSQKNASKLQAHIESLRMSAYTFNIEKITSFMQKCLNADSLKLFEITRFFEVSNIEILTSENRFKITGKTLVDNAGTDHAHEEPTVIEVCFDLHQLTALIENTSKSAKAPSIKLNLIGN